MLCSFVDASYVRKIGSTVTSVSARANIKELIALKHKCSREEKIPPPFREGQVLVNDDFGEDHERINRLLRDNGAYISLKDVHEIRSYNKLSRISQLVKFCAFYGVMTYLSLQQVGLRLHLLFLRHILNLACLVA